jgi:hypothetical protein
MWITFALLSNQSSESPSSQPSGSPTVTPNSGSPNSQPSGSPLIKLNI